MTIIAKARRLFAYSLYLLLGAAVLPTSVSAADLLDAIQQNKLLRVAVVQDYPPFGFADASMKIRGFDVEIAELLASALGARLELVPVTSQNKIPYLVTARADVLLNIGRNPERAKVVDFTQPYAPYYIGIFGPPSLAISRVEELGGRSISVTKGSLEELVLTKSAPPNALIQRFEDNAATISAFLSGQADLVAVGNIVAAAIDARNPARKPEQKFLLMNSPVCAAVVKGETRLLERVNQAIAGARQQGKLNAMAMQWLKQPIPADMQ